ncbi:MAG: exonuclease SbcCD subunit D C-terminal domain-containing protein [Candidatus Cloacimonetes bacterium]|nr:exonuclease SbcCD subunit D C-terminal domain-containing protein [Candidatus Cloacimonadota bacterium]
MRILHTSDLHIGKTLCGRKRYEEFLAFFDWLYDTIKENEIDALLIAGDIFDTTTPSNRAQALYYQFLRNVSTSNCRHIVIIAGNHDSPSFLNAPKELLKILNVHVVADTHDINNEVIILSNPQNVPELIVCAVPYLRDKEIRTVEAGEDMADKERKLLQGILDYYALVGECAEQKRAELAKNIPIVGMGHLFTAGAQTADDDGVRELYVGNLAHVASDVFPSCFSYTALGHLHIPQMVSASETIRYSGSPLPMGFGEANHTKSLCQIDLEPDGVAVKLIEVPTFQHLASVKGDWDTISCKIAELSEKDLNIWLDITYTGDEIMGDLQERLTDSSQDTKLEILRVKNKQLIDRTLEQTITEEALDDLDEREVFNRCMEAHNVPDDQRQELLTAYNEILQALFENDELAE